MHEMSLLRGLIRQIEQIAAANHADRVRVVRLKLGPLAHIEPDHLREHFVEATRGGVADSARLDIETTDELHELTLESVDIESARLASDTVFGHAAEPVSPREPETANDARLPLPSLVALAHRNNQGERPVRSCLAIGAHQKVAVAAWTGETAILTRPIGAMNIASDRAMFDATISRLRRDYNFDPAIVACDMHPDYYTTRWASECGKPLIHVQHHHAHAVACMVEHDLLEREVTAITWDGTGYGSDGTLWGGEILNASVNGFNRVGSLLPFPLPGGEMAILSPNRIAFGMLARTRGAAVLNDGPLLDRLHLADHDARVLVAMIERNVNTPQTSSVGRLFDAVAALLLEIDKVRQEGEAAVRLEAIADQSVCDAYELSIVDDANESALSRADWRAMIEAVTRDCLDGIGPDVIAARFHNTLANWAATIVRLQSPREVVLSGGCFQNRLLTDRVKQAITESRRRVFSHERVPTGDSGLAAGQLAIAMKS